jgi:hypothetical protein
LRELGDGWDESRLEAFDASLPQRDRIRGWVDRLRNAADAVLSAERAASASTEALRLADRDAATAAAELQGVRQ